MGKKDNKRREQLEEALVEQLVEHMMGSMGRRKPQPGFMEEVTENMQAKRARWTKLLVTKAHLCTPDCGLRNGVLVGVPDRAKLADEMNPEELGVVMNSVILTCIEEHTREYSVALLDLETARELVNTLGTAIQKVEKAEVKA